MKRIFYIIIGIVILSETTFSIATGDQKMKPISPPERFLLSGTNLELMKQKALKGDAESAFKIYQHYMLAKIDTISAFPWLYIAANKGHVIAQYNLGYIYMHAEILTNLRLAKFWLEEAKKNGSERAKELLKQLEESESNKID